MTNLEAALAYARQGWHVFPVHDIVDGKCSCSKNGVICGLKRPAPGKHPKIFNGHLKASANESVVRDWWTRWPTANIGVATAPSGLVVLDVDVSNGKKGAESLRQFTDLPQTRLSRTGSGGAHAIYSRPSDLEPQRRIGFREGLDLLGDGYFIAPPSIHYSGGSYVWVNDGAPIVPLPESLRSIFTERPLDASPREDLVPRENLPPASPYVLQHASRRLSAMSPAISGKGGNNQLFAVGSVLLHDYALTIEEAWPLFLEWNARCVPPWTEDEYPEVVDTLRNSMTYARGSYGADRQEAELQEKAAAVRASIFAPAPVEPGSFVEAYVQALADVKAAMGATSDEGITPLFISARDLMGKTFAPTPWIVEGLLTEGGVVVVGGEPKTSKSWVGCEIAMAVATGTKVFGEFSTKPLTTAYVFAEDLDVSVRNRLRSLAAARGLPELVATERMHVQPRGRNLDLVRDEDCALIVASVRRLGPVGLLVLDPLRDMHSGEEDKADSMAPVMKRLRLIGNLLNCTVVVVHHTAKASDTSARRRPGQRLRGSSVIHGSIDGGIYLYDLTGNDEDIFTNSVQSEVKGAKAAGRFSITLKITDDASGSAVKAEWSVERGSKKPEEADHEAEARVLATVTKSPGLPRSTLREICGLNVKRADAAITRLLGTGALTLDEVMRFDETKRMRRVVVINLGIAAQGAA